MAEGRISELEGMTAKSSETETPKEKKEFPRMADAYSTYGMCTEKTGAVFEAVMSENVLVLMSHTKLQNQEVHRTPSRTVAPNPALSRNTLKL